MKLLTTAQIAEACHRTKMTINLRAIRLGLTPYMWAGTTRLWTEAQARRLSVDGLPGAPIGNQNWKGRRQNEPN